MILAARLTDFLAEKERKAKQTHGQYCSVLLGVFLPWCGDEFTDPAQFTDEAMIRFETYLIKERRTRTSGKPLSMVTVRTYLRTVRIFLQWCDVPRGRYQMPKEPVRTVKVLSRAEIDLLERVADTERDRLIVRTLADTGIRLGELLGLTKGDLRANTSERRYLINVIGKGDREREVPVPLGTFNRLKALAAGGGFVFQNHQVSRDGTITRLGTPMQSARVGRIVRALGKKAGLGNRRVYPHLFRHSWATQQCRTMKTTGVSLIDLQRTLGHTSLTMISRVYSHTMPADAYDALMAGLKG